MVTSRGRAVDLGFAVAGVTLGLTSLGYPYGRDQGLYGYIGREWLAGNLPYKTAFDVKTPGIFFVNLVAFWLFGEHMWAIRALELVAVVIPTGLLAGYAATPRGERPRPGLLGLGVLAANILYFGTLDFWNTAQCECWCGLFALAATTVALRSSAEGARGASFAVGLLAGLALVFKPPCLWLVAVPCALQLVRAANAGGSRLRLAARAALCLVLGGALPVLVLLAYFAQAGALLDMYTVYAVMSRHYVVAGRSVHSLREGISAYVGGTLLFKAYLAPLLTAAVVGLAAARSRGDGQTASRYATCLACMLGGSLMVVAQLKFFMYHWGAMSGVLAFTLTTVTADLSERRAARLAEGALERRVVLAVGIALVSAFVFSGVQASRSALVARRAYYAWKDGDSRPLDELFIIPWFYSWPETKEVADYLSEVSRPGDIVAVRGFEPQIYIACRRRYGGRFFWTTFLTDRRYHPDPEALLGEDLAAFKASPPRFVVANDFVHEGVAAAEPYERIGYVRMATLQNYVVLERGEHLDFSVPW